MFNIFKRKTVPTQTPLEALQTRSATAVNTIRATVDSLRTTNVDIDTEHASNDAAITALNATNDALDALKASNEKVIANFENI